jgi:hypothetical protein
MIQKIKKLEEFKIKANEILEALLFNKNVKTGHYKF